MKNLLYTITGLLCICNLQGCKKDYKYGDEYNCRIIVHALQVSPTLPANLFPLRVYIDGELLGFITSADTAFISPDDLCSNPDAFTSAVYIDKSDWNTDVDVTSNAGSYFVNVNPTPQECKIVTFEL